VGELHGLAESLGIEKTITLTKPKLIDRILAHFLAGGSAPAGHRENSGMIVQRRRSRKTTRPGSGRGRDPTISRPERRRPGRWKPATETNTSTAPKPKVLARNRSRPEPVKARGVLQLLPEGYGFLRHVEMGYLSGPDDVYVGGGVIRRFNLRSGDLLDCQVGPSPSGTRNRRLIRLEAVNGHPPDPNVRRRHFRDLLPRYPDRKLRLEIAGGSLAMRVVDLLAPVGKGQRGLIVSPPKAGKTTILREMAQAVEANDPESHLIVLLIDERPEEVTEMRDSIKGDVVASTFDSGPVRHVQVAEVVFDRARRLAEDRRDVVILLDSITRLARAYNANMPQSGRIMSGGVDAKALQKPKKFFGTARDLTGGGSVTVVATALVDTGSRMDEVIFEEFKGTGNMELVLDRDIADRRIFPAIDINRSGTRKEELLLSEVELNRVHILRNFLAEMTPDEAISFLLGAMAGYRTNSDFLAAMAKGG